MQISGSRKLVLYTEKYNTENCRAVNIQSLEEVLSLPLLLIPMLLGTSSRYLLHHSNLLYYSFQCYRIPVVGICCIQTGTRCRNPLHHSNNLYYSFQCHRVPLVAIFNIIKTTSTILR